MSSIVFGRYAFSVFARDIPGVLNSIVIAVRPYTLPSFNMTTIEGNVAIFQILGTRYWNVRFREASLIALSF